MSYKVLQNSYGYGRNQNDDEGQSYNSKGLFGDADLNSLSGQYGLDFGAANGGRGRGGGGGAGVQSVASTPGNVAHPVVAVISGSQDSSRAQQPILFGLTAGGFHWLCAVFAIMALAAIIIAFLSMRLRYRQRTLHLFSVAVLVTAAIAYFCMAIEVGWILHPSVQDGLHGYRQIWYVRYIMWFICAPLLVTLLLLTAGMPTNIILSTVFATCTGIVCALIASLLTSSHKWAFLVFGLVAMFWVFWNLISGMKKAEELGGADYQKKYIILAGFLILLACLYPVCWGLSEGSHTITVTSEMVFYGILDLLAMPVFLGLLLYLHRNTNLENLGLGTDYRLNQIEQHRSGGSGGYGEAKHLLSTTTTHATTSPLTGNMTVVTQEKQGLLLPDQVATSSSVGGGAYTGR